MRGFQRFSDLLRDRQRFVDGYGTTREALREVFTLNEFHDEGTDTDSPRP